MTDLGRPADWQFALCDVGQGDATVVRSAGQIALVDIGPEPARLATCLDELGIDRIQLLVLTHYDLDHVGGVDAVVGRVDRVLDRPGVRCRRCADRRARSGRRRCRRSTRSRRGEHGMLGELDWQVLWPPPARRRARQPGERHDRGDAGGAARGCLSGIFLGDLGEESQLRLLAARPVPGTSTS